MYPGVSATPAVVKRNGLPTRPAFAGLSHMSEGTGESVYANKFRGAPAAAKRAEADRASVASSLRAFQSADASRTAASAARIRESLAPAAVARALLVKAGQAEMTPERALARVTASLDTANARTVADAVDARNKGNAVPIMVNGTLAIADAGSDPAVAYARSRELRSADRYPAPINPLGAALTAPTTADQAASREWMPELPSSQAAAMTAIAKRSSSLFGAAEDLGVDPLTGETLTASGADQFTQTAADKARAAAAYSAAQPAKISPVLIGVAALAAFLLLKGR